MKAAQMVLNDMKKYHQKVINNPHYPKPVKGIKVSKEDDFFWTEFHHREIEAVERMIARQEMRMSGREGLPDNSEGQSDTAEQDQELPQDSVLRPKKERKDKIRSFFGYSKYLGP